MLFVQSSLILNKYLMSKESPFDVNNTGSTVRKICLQSLTKGLCTLLCVVCHAVPMHVHHSAPLCVWHCVVTRYAFVVVVHIYTQLPAIFFEPDRLNFMWKNRPYVHTPCMQLKFMCVLPFLSNLLMEFNIKYLLHALSMGLRLRTSPHIE